jgi:hypothetical protein
MFHPEQSSEFNDFDKKSRWLCIKLHMKRKSTSGRLTVKNNTKCQLLVGLIQQQGHA